MPHKAEQFIPTNDLLARKMRLTRNTPERNVASLSSICSQFSMKRPAAVALNKASMKGIVLYRSKKMETPEQILQSRSTGRTVPSRFRGVDRKHKPESSDDSWW